MRRGALTIILALACAGRAEAACPQQGARQQAELAGVILSGVVESGPLSPATIRVERWEKGRGVGGSEFIEVETGVHEDYVLSEGIDPRPGERWRIFGTWEGELVVTGVCHGSRRLDAPPAAPSLAGVPLAPARFAGRPLTGALPRLAVGPGRLRLSLPVADARLLGAPRGVRLIARRGRLRLRVAPRARRLGRLVVDTGSGFYAARIVRR